jgi:hypothetical protein
MKTGTGFENQMVRYREHAMKCLAPIPALPRLRTSDVRTGKKAWLSRERIIMAIVVLSFTAAGGAWIGYLHSLCSKADQELKAANKESAG